MRDTESVGRTFALDLPASAGFAPPPLAEFLPRWKAFRVIPWHKIISERIAKQVLGQILEPWETPKRRDRGVKTISAIK